MAERYERLLKLKNNLYTEGSPVIIEAGALLKDTLTNKVIVQLKFLNLGEKQIDFLTVKLTTYDPQDNKNNDTIEFQYMDIKAKKNGYFGAKTPIVLEDNTVRNIDVSVSKIIFSDKTSQELAETFLPVEEMDLLEKRLSDKELIWQYRKELIKQCGVETGFFCEYAPKKHMDLYYCICGAIGKTEVCRVCNRSISQQIEKCDIDYLKEKAEQAAVEKRIAKEKVKKKAIKAKEKAAVIGKQIINSGAKFFREKSSDDK